LRFMARIRICPQDLRNASPPPFGDRASGAPLQAAWRIFGQEEADHFNFFQQLAASRLPSKREALTVCTAAWRLPLAKRWAVTHCGAGGLQREQITHLIVVSCPVLRSRPSISADTTAGDSASAERSLIGFSMGCCGLKRPELAMRSAAPPRQPTGADGLRESSAPGICSVDNCGEVGDRHRGTLRMGAARCVLSAGSNGSADLSGQAPAAPPSTRLRR